VRGLHDGATVLRVRRLPDAPTHPAAPVDPGSSRCLDQTCFPRYDSNDDEDRTMTDNVENLILEHLRAIRADMAGLYTAMNGVKERLASLEDHVAGMRKDMSLLHSDITITHHRIDGLEKRVERIERRLDLRDQP
jgi:septal ring factor EnvC (AmiA/AmiB activator)